MKGLLIIHFLILIHLDISAQAIYSAKDVEIINSIFSDAGKLNLSDSSPGSIVIQAGRHLLGHPYIGGILDKAENEQLVINLGELDCVTFLESTLALAISIKEHKTHFEDFCDELKFIRYRDGEMNGYASRLHYFYDWIDNNEDKGIILNITESLGGKPFIKEINCMSENRTNYPRLKDDSSVGAIRKVEERLSSMAKYFIPKDEMRMCMNGIHDGDLIAIATTVKGLEVAHVGIAIHVNQELHLMHASSVNKKVEISELPLYEMLQNKSIWSGIIVSRLKN